MNSIVKYVFDVASVVLLSSISFGYSGGDGTSANPYQIANVADFLQLSTTSAHWSKSIVLTANIVFDTNIPAQVFTKSPSRRIQVTVIRGILMVQVHRRL